MAKNQTEVLDTAATVSDSEVTSADQTAATLAATPAAKYDYTKLNTLAVVSLATAISWVGSVAGIITGHIALAQIKRSGEKGRGLAITGLVLGYLYVAGSLFFGLLMLLFSMRGWVDGGYGQMGGYRMGPGMMGDWDNR